VLEGHLRQENVRNSGEKGKNSRTCRGEQFASTGPLWLSGGIWRVWQRSQERVRADVRDQSLRPPADAYRGREYGVNLEL